MFTEPQYAEQLIQRLKPYLPCTVIPTSRLVHNLREQGIKIKPREKLEASEFHYAGDIGGICCVINGRKDTNLVISITHVNFDKNHPLYKELKYYQLARINDLAKQNNP